MDIQDLEGFVAVVRCGSFSRAAQLTFRTQPAVSLQVARLERDLGVRLLDRSGRQARPTREGASVAAAADEILDQLRRLKTIAQDRPAGELVIGAGQAVAALLLPGPLRAFCRQFPAVQVRVTTAPTRALLDSMVAGRVDLAILSAAIAVPGIQVRPLRRYGFVARGGGIDAPLLLPESGSAMSTHILGALLAGGIAPRVALETASIQLAIALARAGLGTAVIPSFAAKGKRLDRWIGPLTLCLAWRKGTSDLARDTLADLIAWAAKKMAGTR